MKRLIFCATLVMLITSCMKNDVEVGYEVQRTEDFIATFADDTRADLDGTAVVWNADDHLTIFTKTSHNRQYKVKDLSANGRSATFEYVGYTGSDKTAISNNYAVYPYDAEATILGDVITTTLASEQTYNAECYLTYALMSAKSATNNFSFVNSGALLRFNISTILPDTFDLNYIKVSSQSHNIAGEVTIDTNDHLAVVANNGTNEITLVEINETIDSDVKSFYIAMPAISFEKSDLSVTFSFADGNKTFALPAFDLEQGKIKSIDYTIKDAEEFTGSTPGEDVPAVAKPANNEIWYTNGSTTEATTPNKTNVFGANIVSNTYDAAKECWVIKFDGDVTTIGEWAFSGRSALTSVAIPKSITAVEKGAFYGCNSLTSVYISDMSAWCKINFDTSIGNLNHYAKNLYLDNELVTDLIIPSDITEIKYGTFFNLDNLTSVTIPDSITTIAEESFRNCGNLTEFKGKYASKDGRCLIIDGTLVAFARAGLTEYTIPDSVTKIGNYAFSNCSNIINLTIPDSVIAIGDRAFSNCSNIEHLILPSSITSMGEYSWAGCGGKIKINCILPGGENSSINGTFKDAAFTEVVFDESVTSIGEYLFYNCDQLTNVVIPEGVETIKGHAFQNCDAITNITIPNSVTSIGGYIFDYCKSLTTVNIGQGVKSIPYCAFCGCSSLINMTIPEHIDSIDDEAFYRCSNMESVIIENGVTSIGWEAFGYCTSLTNINIPDSVTSIGAKAFYNCSSLTSVTIPDSVTEIVNYAFYECSSLTSVTIPDSVTRIGDYTFYGCSSLTNITIPESVTNIADSAFEQCSSLTSVTIPSCVYNIGSCAFQNCNNLRSVECKATTPPWVYSDSFYNNASGRKIYVPMESVDAYRMDPGWDEYVLDIVGYNF